MDTKSRSIKPAIAFLSFVLGITLLFFSGAVAFCAVRELGWTELTDAFQSDYQDTSRFRSVITDWFTRMGTGEFTEVEGLTDRNLLYRIEREGQPVQTNCPELTSDNLPDGYNFLLSFDGDTITVQKNGRNVNIYGAGIYRDNSLWALPGYQNFPISDSYSDVTLLLAAAKEPCIYATPADIVQYSMAYDSGLYDVAASQQRVRSLLFWMLAIPLTVGISLLLWSILWHKHKLRADQAIAWFTGRIWLEVKLLLLIPFSLVCLLAIYLTSHAFLYNQFHYSLLPYCSIPAAMWWAYLYLNDLRYNFGSIRLHSLCAALARLYQGKELRWPAGQRIVRRSVLQFVATLPFILCCMILFLLLLPSALYNGFLLCILFVLAIAGLALIAAQLWLLRQNHRTAADMDAMLVRIQAAGTGDISSAPPLEDPDLRAAAEGLDQIEARLKSALEDQMKSERLKLELITNVSHDLKTPLTSIISYAELLRQEENLPDHVRDYIQVLYQKAQRLQTMVLDVFDVSKAATGNLAVTVRPLDFSKLLRQTLADQEEDIQASSLILRLTLPDEPVWILADGDRLYRVFQNLIGNALKYSLEGSRVYLTLTVDQGKAVATVQNTSRDELPPGVDFTERFVRGDQSRTDGGSGLGLSIARTFTESCNGSFAIRTQADLFTASVTFSLTDARPEPEVAP